MLKTIIKRNGGTEEFTAEKLNKWSRWAAEDIQDRVDWPSVVLDAVRNCKEEMTSQELQGRLIDSCISYNSWPYYLMAGRLYAAIMKKKTYGNSIPTVKKINKKLAKLGLMRRLKYTEAEYEEIETIIDHNRDFKMAHFQIEYIIHKYSVQDRTSKEKYETPQFVYMRMAMALAEDEVEDKMFHLKNWYDHFSFNRINAPTPNYVNLGTTHYGLASCCLYASGDSAKSLAIGDHIAYTQTYMSAGIGTNLLCRSLGDPVRKGSISHMGKLPYYAALGKAVKANIQGGRGGACNVYYSAFDPEVLAITMLQNPRTTVDKQNRDLHFTILTNRFFAKKVAENEDIFTFNVHTAPDLHTLFYSDKQDEFEVLYNVYLNNTKFKKDFISARKILVTAGLQGYDVATLYYAIIDEINRHTSYKEPILSGNLCNEIVQPTKPYENMMDLYSEEDHGRGEVSLCSIAAIVEPNIKSDEEYSSACYYAEKMVDKCIDIADYALPHIGLTAKARRNMGIGLVGVATTMARNNLKYDTLEGRNKLHEIAERHSYFVILNSLKLGISEGNAPWIDKTKWPDGWLPIDTYKKAVDELVTVGYKYDWEELRKLIKINKGIRHSSVVAHMPTESSSKASGVPNSIYSIRELYLDKTDGTSKINWCATDSDLLANKYQLAWNISEIDMVKAYSIFQKFADQAISADLYKDRSKVIEVTSMDIIETYLTMVKYGQKTRYYMNSKTTNGENKEVETGCSSGACTI